VPLGGLRGLVTGFEKGDEEGGVAKGGCWNNWVEGFSNKISKVIRYPSRLKMSRRCEELLLEKRREGCR